MVSSLDVYHGGDIALVYWEDAAMQRIGWEEIAARIVEVRRHITSRSGIGDLFCNFFSFLV